MRDDTWIGLIFVAPKTHPWPIQSINTSFLCHSLHFVLLNQQNRLGHTLNAPYTIQIGPNDRNMAKGPDVELVKCAEAKFGDNQANEIRQIEVWG